MASKCSLHSSCVNQGRRYLLCAAVWRTRPTRPDVTRSLARHGSTSEGELSFIERQEKTNETLVKLLQKLDERLEKQDQRLEKQDQRLEKLDQRLEQRLEKQDQRLEKQDQRLAKLDQRLAKQDDFIDIMKGISRRFQRVQEGTDRQTVAVRLGSAFNRSRRLDSVGEFFIPYINPEAPPAHGTISLALENLAKDLAKDDGNLDKLHDAVLHSLCKLCRNRTLPLEDDVDEDALLKSTTLGEWIPHIQRAGFNALGLSVERLVKTYKKRTDVEFLISCESFGVALLILASDEDLYWDAIAKAATPTDLLHGLPPEKLELDCVGRAYVLATGIPVIEVGEIKDSKDSDDWQKGMLQLRRSLNAIAFALAFTAPTLKSLLPPDFAEAKVLRVGYLCVPEAPDKDVATALEQSISDWTKERKDERLVIKPVVI